MTKEIDIQHQQQKIDCEAFKEQLANQLAIHFNFFSETELETFFEFIKRLEPTDF